MNGTSTDNVIPSADIRNAEIMRIKKLNLGCRARRQANTAETAGELGLPRTHFYLPPSNKGRLNHFIEAGAVLPLIPIARPNNESLRRLISQE